MSRVSSKVGNEWRKYVPALPSWLRRKPADLPKPDKSKAITIEEAAKLAAHER